jgi:hypothetical protein
MQYSLILNQYLVTANLYKMEWNILNIIQVYTRLTRAPEIVLVPRHMLFRAKVPAEYYCHTGVFKLNKEVLTVLKYHSVQA